MNKKIRNIIPYLHPLVSLYFLSLEIEIREIIDETVAVIISIYFSFFCRLSWNLIMIRPAVKTINTVNIGMNSVPSWFLSCILLFSFFISSVSALFKQKIADIKNIIIIIIPSRNFFPSFLLFLKVSTNNFLSIII